MSSLKVGDKVLFSPSWENKSVAATIIGIDKSKDPSAFYPNGFSYDEWCSPYHIHLDEKLEFCNDDVWTEKQHLKIIKEKKRS